ncbi:hypothetical protein ACSW9O_15625 (plasmid) [Clostridium perfringens]|nr:hypothetical protein [Clostridium perfringens]
MSSFKEMKESIYDFICENIELGLGFDGEKFCDAIFEEFKYLPDQTNNCLNTLVKEGKLAKVGLANGYIRVK